MNDLRYSSNFLSVKTLSHSSGEEKSTHELRSQGRLLKTNSMAGVLRKHALTVVSEPHEIIND